MADPGLVLQLTRGSFAPYDAVCPRAGCTVGYSSAARLIVCPGHGSEFDPTAGAVLAEPAPRGLGTIPVTKGGNAQLYVDQ
ncbi:MAG TPA: Rieske (2Fe-2S) protein [Acidimicrobiales bacterium]|nr:Rieske (2Fe-2S) protein [Acidimicrobiales bacterium]